MTWDATDQTELINQPLLMIAGEKADSLYMTQDAFNKAVGAKDKELQDLNNDVIAGLLGQWLNENKLK